MISRLVMSGIDCVRRKEASEMSEQKTDDDVKKAWKAYKKEFDGAVKKLNDTLDKLAADLEIRYAEINAAHEQM